MKKLWLDDAGFIVSLELLLIATILVLGLVACWTSLRNAMVAEFLVIEQTILGLHPSIEQVDFHPPVVIKAAPVVDDDVPIVSLLP
jgi:hypothetical protein